MKENILIQPIVPLTSLFAVGRELVALIDLKEIQDEFYRGTERQIRKYGLGQVYMPIDHDAMNKMVAEYQRSVGFAHLTYYRSEWADPGYFTKENVEELFEWRIPAELNRIYWNIINSHQEDYYFEGREIIWDRICQLRQKIKRDCLCCNAGVEIKCDPHTKVYYHPSFVGQGYTWANPSKCPASDAVGRCMQLTADLRKLLMKPV
jgi:hypothetical protein